MPLLREEAEKLSNNELEQGVIETLSFVTTCLPSCLS